MVSVGGGGPSGVISKSLVFKQFLVQIVGL